MKSDTDRHERIDAEWLDAPLTPEERIKAKRARGECAIEKWRASARAEVVTWLEMRVKASRLYQEDAKILAGFEALLELARVLR